MDFERRFGGLVRLYGERGAQAIYQAHVVIIGLGGVGSWAAESLARSGVGRLTLIDMDHVAESNINRQVMALDSTLGQAKVLALRDRIALINPSCAVTCIEEFVTPENIAMIMPKDAQAVIDACDQVHAKVALTAWAKKSKCCFVTVGAAGGKRHAHLVDIDDLSKVTHDPLLAQCRYQLRKVHGAAREGKRMGVHCVFSREAVKSPDQVCDAAADDATLNCHGYGSVVSVTATFGICAAGWVLDKLANFAAAKTNQP
ncbi:MAG TPA: tRNA threonylcarbamoyladenosine dehydratase [Burkholderiaceae bacterium]|nr:tRNA threonylcarbamoyladenosine dehydratase [Burkholderiaceae bacterium]